MICPFTSPHVKNISRYFSRTDTFLFGLLWTVSIEGFVAEHGLSKTSPKVCGRVVEESGLSLQTDVSTRAFFQKSHARKKISREMQTRRIINTVFEPV